MRFRILGPLEVESDGRAVALGGAKPRAVLAVLLLHANEPVSAERLALALWGEDAPAGAVRTVQVHVSRLRKALADADVLTSTGTAYSLRVRPGELDAHEFEQLVAEGRKALAAGQAAQAAATLREALSLWRGPPLDELASLPFAPPEIKRLEEQRLAALEARVEADLAAGRHAELVGELQRLTSRHPWRERLQRDLMLALYRCGRQAEALEVYRETRRLFADELGIEPSEDLRRLEAQMLDHDPELEPPAPVAPAAHRAAAARGAVAQAAERGVRRAGVGRGRCAAGSGDDARRARPPRRRCEALERHGGVVEKSIGDAVVAVFGIDQTREDDARRAVRAAVELRDSVDLGMRIAVNSGEAFVGAGAGREPFATGDAINVTERLQEAATPGEILLGELTCRLAEGLVSVEPRGGRRSGGLAAARPAARRGRAAADLGDAVRRAGGGARSAPLRAGGRVPGRRVSPGDARWGRRGSGSRASSAS